MIDTISSEGIQGTVGKVRVIVPNPKIHDILYNEKAGTYSYLMTHGDPKPITIGDYLRARVIETTVDGGTFLVI